MDQDNERMARLKAGDVSALEELIHSHRESAMTLARSLLHDNALAEDAVQEAFARVYLARGDYRPTFTFRTWLMTLVRNLCVDQLRRLKRLPVPMAELPEAPTESAESVFLREDRRMRLLSRLSRLPEVDRRLLTGYALEGQSYRELAQTLHLTTAQVKIRLFRLRQTLRKEDDPYD